MELWQVTGRALSAAKEASARTMTLCWWMGGVESSLELEGDGGGEREATRTAPGESGSASGGSWEAVAGEI
jgi:hypothetical protein